jgi:hypothetical protein
VLTRNLFIKCGRLACVPMARPWPRCRRPLAVRVRVEDNRGYGREVPAPCPAVTAYRRVCELRQRYTCQPRVRAIRALSPRACTRSL